MSLAYTVRLKEQPLIDVFILAALYTIRLFAGGEASGHPVSMWLLGFSSFLFLSLALVKRVSELYRLQSTALRQDRAARLQCAGPRDAADVRQRGDLRICRRAVALCAERHGIARL